MHAKAFIKPELEILQSNLHFPNKFGFKLRHYFALRKAIQRKYFKDSQVLPR